MNFLFYFGHPAHFHLFKNTVVELKKKGHRVDILIKKKDILEELLQSAGLLYFNINPKGRADHKISIAWNLLMRDIEFFRFARKHKPHVMIGTSAEITHAGKLLGIPSVVVNEDDAEAVPLFARLAYPFATNILSPDCCSVGKWEKKKIGYNSYHELAYLHPNYFTPDKSKIKNLNPEIPYFILRFAKLTAHHDTGCSGLTTELAEQVIARLEKQGRVYITSERKLEPQFEKYRIQIPPLDIHHAIYFAQMYIGDSQTMAAEAAVLGTPGVRFNDFVGRLNYLEELEYSYKLTFGIGTNEPEKLLSKMDELLSTPDLKKEWSIRRNKMLEEKIDLTKFMVWLFENYPSSVQKNSIQNFFKNS